MSDLDELLERLLLDPRFKAGLAADPDRALAGYRLSDDERASLTSDVIPDQGGQSLVEVPDPDDRAGVEDVVAVGLSPLAGDRHEEDQPSVSGIHSYDADAVPSDADDEGRAFDLPEHAGASETVSDEEIAALLDAASPGASEPQLGLSPDEIAALLYAPDAEPAPSSEPAPADDEIAALHEPPELVAAEPDPGPSDDEFAAFLDAVAAEPTAPPDRALGEDEIAEMLAPSEPVSAEPATVPSDDEIAAFLAPDPESAGPSEPAFDDEAAPRDQPEPIAVEDQVAAVPGRPAPISTEPEPVALDDGIAALLDEPVPEPAAPSEPAPDDDQVATLDPADREPAAPEVAPVDDEFALLLDPTGPAPAEPQISPAPPDHEAATPHPDEGQAPGRFDADHADPTTADSEWYVAAPGADDTILVGAEGDEPASVEDPALGDAAQATGEEPDLAGPAPAESDQPASIYGDTRAVDAEREAGIETAAPEQATVPDNATAAAPETYHSSPADTEPDRTTPEQATVPDNATAAAPETYHPSPADTEPDRTTPEQATVPDDATDVDTDTAAPEPDTMPVGGSPRDSLVEEAGAAVGDHDTESAGSEDDSMSGVGSSDPATDPSRPGLEDLEEAASSPYDLATDNGRSAFVPTERGGGPDADLTVGPSGAESTAAQPTPAAGAAVSEPSGDTTSAPDAATLPDDTTHDPTYDDGPTPVAEIHHEDNEPLADEAVTDQPVTDQPVTDDDADPSIARPEFRADDEH